MSNVDQWGLGTKVVVINAKSVHFKETGTIHVNGDGLVTTALSEGYSVKFKRHSFDDVLWFHRSELALAKEVSQ